MMSPMPWTLSVLLVVAMTLGNSHADLDLPAGFDRNHTNNWAVLVDTSR